MLINLNKMPIQEWEKRGLVFRHCFGKPAGVSTDGASIDANLFPNQTAKLWGGGGRGPGRPVGTGPRGARGGLRVEGFGGLSFFLPQQQPPQSAMTMMCWSKIPAAQDFGIFSFGSDASPAGRYASMSCTSANEATFYMGGYNSAGDVTTRLLRRGGTYTSNIWQHWCMRWDGGSGTGVNGAVRGYLNAVRNDVSSDDAGTFNGTVYSASDISPTLGGYVWGTQFSVLNGIPSCAQDDFRLYNRALDESEIYAIFAQGYTPPPDIANYADIWSYELVIRPDADVSDGTWTDQAGGTSLFAAIDEPTADDTDYIQSADVPVNDVCQVSLSDFTGTPGQPFRVHYRYWRTGASGSMELRVRLLQGATQIASWTHSAISTTPADAVQTLSSGEFASISDFTDLRLEFRGNQT